MARPCPRCHSRSIKYDRSLGGRAVCGACGLPVGAQWVGRTSSTGAKRHGGRPASLRLGRALAWLLPLGLVAALLYLIANPRAITPSPSIRLPPGQNRS